MNLGLKFELIVKSCSLITIAIGIQYGVSAIASNEPNLHLTTTVYLGAILVIGIILHSIAQAAHTVQHKFRHDALANIMTSGTVYLNKRAAGSHLNHHRHFGTVNDPDSEIYRDPPTTRSGFIVRLLKVIFLVRMLPSLKRSNGSKPLTDNKQPADKVSNPYGFIIISQLLIFILFLATTNWYSYLLFWLVPLGIAKSINDTRVFIEHFPLYGNKQPALRNFDPKSITSRLFGHYGFSEHGFHHIAPGISPYSYAQIRPTDKAKVDFTETGYLGFLLVLLASYPEAHQ